MPTINTRLMTLTDGEISTLVEQLPYESLGLMMFQSKHNRDAVAKAAKAAGLDVKRGSTGHQLLDPRYTVEGKGPDRGLANDYRHSFANLYTLDMKS